MAIQNKLKLKRGSVNASYFKLPHSSRSGVAITSGIFSLIGITILSGAVLANTTGGAYTGINKASAVTISDTESVSAAVQVVDSCTIGKTSESTTDAVTIPTGTYNSNVKNTTMKVICNDPSGFDVYAVGYGGDKEGTTAMINKNDASYAIPTGIEKSGDTSNWAMKIESDSASGTYAPIILNDFDADFKEVPSTRTKVAAYESVVDSSVGSSFTATYAAYVTYGQQAGTYEGKVMYLLSHPSTTTFATYMQDLDATTIASLLPNTGSTATVVDRRDGKSYTIAKLADGKYWMVTSLNLTGGTKLYSDDSNVATGYPSSGGTPYYTLPASTAISSGTSVPSDQFSNDATAYVFNTGNETTNCSSSSPCNSYYSWIAATAGSGSSISANNADASYSICPKGWRLPKSRSSVSTDSDFYSLAVAYGMSSGSTFQNTSNFYNQAGPGTLPNFLLSGFYNGGGFLNGGSDGYYWSATSSSGTIAYNLYFASGFVNSAANNFRRYGYAVRCVFAG